MKEGISIGTGIFWVAVWFGFMLLYTLLDVAGWRRLAPAHAGELNLIFMVLCAAVFLRLLKTETHFQIHLFEGVSPSGILLAVGCIPALYLLLDKGLDPVFEGFFPASEESYRETLQSLSRAPVVSLLQVCILAPVMEEILMRGFLLGGLSAKYGGGIALILSALLFALLHFNMVQTLSALICGLVLGWIYLQTGSLACCILTHAGYNLISSLTVLLPLP